MQNKNVRNSETFLFRDPDGTIRLMVVGFDPVEEELGFYGTVGSSDPTWVISSKLSSINIADETGIVLMTVTGPNEEQITYSGTLE